MSDIVLDLLRANQKFTHREHQLAGIRALLEHPFFGLFDEVGAGKSKQIVDTSQILFLRQQEIDTALVLTPGFARSTWAEEDPFLGEVAKHAWDVVPNVIHEYHKHYTELEFQPNALNWVVSNYEFVRRAERLHDLLAQLRGRRTWLILDESWAIKGFSDQMKACRMLRVKRASKVVELNGTPLADGKPIDLYYQMMILDPDILGVVNRTQFKTKYCIMGGFKDKQVVAYKNLDELNQRIAPYVLSRRTRDCFDLPPMLPPVIVEARFSQPEWAIYKEMRDDMVATLGNSASSAKQAIVKALRLAQICSGFLGGFEELISDDDDPFITQPQGIDKFGPQPQWLRRIAGEQETTVQAEAQGQPVSQPVPGDEAAPRITPAFQTCREIGRSKLDAFLNWLDTRDPSPHKLLVWCRFKPELARTTDELKKVYPNVFQLRGGQTKADRLAAKEFLAPGSDPRAGAVVGNQKAGGASLNFAACNIAVYLSNGPALIERTQSIGRIERPGATQPMSVVDVIATGPKGQKTFDHAVLKALRSKDDMSQWTVNQWRKILAEV